MDLSRKEKVHLRQNDYIQPENNINQLADDKGGEFCSRQAL
jgi:hypothetical protein